MDRAVIEVPHLLKEYEAELIAAQRKYVQIRAIPLNNSIIEDTLDLKASKFLGKPFFTSTKKYPLDKSGNPMVLIAQLNFSEVPKLEGYPTNGLLQLYFPLDDWYDLDSAEILFWSEKELLAAPSLDYSFLEKQNIDELPVWKMHRLEFIKAIDTGCSEDSQFDVSFGGDNYWDFEDKLSDADKKVFEQYFSSNGHKIGGYAYFTQSDPRDYRESERDDIQLLQIDVDDYIMFGDSGLGHIFINPNDLAESKFDKAYFYWDCC